MTELILLVGPCLAGFGLYLVGYLALTLLGTRWRPNEVEFWEQYPVMITLFVLGAMWGTTSGAVERLQFEAVLGWGGAWAAANHLVLSVLLLGRVGRRAAALPPTRPPRAHYNCAACFAPVPDRLTECPCCTEKVPFAERADQLLPLPSTSQPLASEQLPRSVGVA